MEAYLLGSGQQGGQVVFRSSLSFVKMNKTSFLNNVIILMMAEETDVGASCRGHLGRLLPLLRRPNQEEQVNHEPAHDERHEGETEALASVGCGWVGWSHPVEQVNHELAHDERHE